MSIALATGSAVFLYMALADWMPRHRQHMPLREAWIQGLPVLGGTSLLLALAH